MWKNKAIRYTWLTLAFYALLIVLSNWFEHLSPAGPCVPGGGDMLVLFSPLLIFPLFVVSLIRFIKGHRRHFGPLLVHALVIVGFLIVIHP
jgi:hypothetical protein